MQTTDHTVPGLRAPVDILLTPGGLPHIRAASEPDLFFAQGWNAARDRLWQIDLWRKRGLGLLAADFGPGYLAQDRASRLLLYRGDMAAEWACYAPDAEAICAAFAAGINAYVAGVEAGTLPLPPEFALMGTRPARWAAEDVVRIRSHALTRNAISEILRAKLLHAGHQHAEALRQHLVPPADLSAEPIPDLPVAVLDAFRLATAGVTFEPERLAATLAEAPRWAKVDAAGEVIAAPPEGSNNWAVAAHRTGTGRPLLALDPHRAHAIPSLRYMVHLSAPGLDVLGGGEPAVPGISMGHNGTAAFALTIFGADQEDLVVLDLHPDDPARFRWQDGWDAIEAVDETAEVRGEAPQTHRLEFCRHGPVLWRDPEGRRAVALRTVWSRPGAAAYMASLSVMRARSHADWRKALRGWGAPSINHLYADVAGDIAWQAVGWTPLREGRTGLLPVPGDGSAEWAGLVDPDAMPHRLNPPEGFLATANAFNVPADWAAANPPLGREWFEPSRHDRLHDVLAEGTHGPAEALILQNDVTSRAALRLTALLRAAPPPADPQAARAAALLTEWDGAMTVDSAAAALCELWTTAHLKPALFALAAPAELHPLIAPGDTEAMLTTLETPGPLFPGPDARDALLHETLAAAWAAAEARLGPDPSGWRWGDLHRLHFAHAVERAHPDAGLSLPPAPWPGSLNTVMLGAYRPTDFAVTFGPSVRMVIDVGNWDATVWTNLPGQSGDPDSPHHADFPAGWGPQGYRPAPYAAAAVEAAATARLRLIPA